MVKNPPEGMPRITPSLFYDDVGAALDFLGKAFGFETRFAHRQPDGTIVHAEVKLQDGVVMLSPTGPNALYGKSPRALPAVNQMLYVYVDDVDAHCRRARAAGAKIMAEPEDKFYGDRNYMAQDPEGHVWGFGQHVKDVAPEDMQPPAA